MSNDGGRDATVRTLTAEVHVLMVGSRQVTLSVYGQLDEVDYEDIEPFGRVRPRDAGGYTCLIGRHRIGGTLVRSKIPSDYDLIERLAGFNRLAYDEKLREATYLEGRLAFYEKYPESQSFPSDEDQGVKITGAEKAAEVRKAAARLRAQADAMYEKFCEKRAPHLERAEQVDDLPLIVLAGLR